MAEDVGWWRRKNEAEESVYVLALHAATHLDVDAFSKSRRGGRHSMVVMVSFNARREAGHIPLPYAFRKEPKKRRA
jgi:hypothetical protein